jgi:DNA-binding SARP family transcriptional activator/tetratricopeptide (TPR) repeat protein
VIQLRLFGSPDLRRDPGGEALSVLAQPKRFAVLAWLALAHPRGIHRRDTLLALFWPELDATHARAALRKTVYHLRQALGADAVINRGDEELGLGPGFWCDAVEFQEAIAAGRGEAALALYRGDLLPGFHLSDVPDFEQWLEEERDRLRRLAVAAAWTLAGEKEAHGHPDALAWGTRAMALAPDDESGLRRLLTLLDRHGDRDEAVRVYDEYHRRLAHAYEVEPSPETQALIETIRARPPAAMDPAAQMPAAPGGVSGPVPLPVSRPSGDPARVRAGVADAVPAGVAHAVPAGVADAVADPVRRRRRPGLRHAAALAGLSLLLASAIAIAWPHLRPSDRPPIIAIGHIRDFMAAESGSIAEALPDLLATNLSRAPELHVVSPTRIHEMLARKASINQVTALLATAREAGAEQVVEGALYRQSDGMLRLDLRRVRLRDASVLSSHTVSGADAFALVDRATTELLREWGAVPRPLHVAEVTTRSLVAYRFYQQGLRTYYRGDSSASTRLFHAALEEDSTFAMAAYYASRASASNWQQSARYLELAMSRLEHAAPREQLLIRLRWADLHNEPARLAIAETLAVRFPAEPEGHLMLGGMQTWAGDFHAAIPRFLTALAMDSAAPGGTSSVCTACEALAGLLTAYALADSMPAAEAVAREWHRRFPSSIGASDALARVLEYQGMVAEAMELRRAASSLHPSAGDLGVWLWPGIYAIRQGDWAGADSFLRMRAQVGTETERREALWYLVISLRHQGRFGEALETARQFRAASQRALPAADPPPASALTEAIVLYEMGRHREAAALWDSLAHAARGMAGDARQARQLAWLHTQAAAALSAAGDTVAVKRLIPRIEEYGGHSAYGRDPRLHHHARGLLHVARGDDARAAVAFRRAIFSVTGGYTRTNLELARVLLRLRQPEEAIAVLRAAFRGPLQASNLYVTHTELHEALGQAFDMAGQPDSATVHLCWAERARLNADPPFRSRNTGRCRP